MNKATGQAAIDRVTGSGAFVAASRTSLLVVLDRDDTERRLMLPVKQNLTANVGGLAYRIVDSQTVVEGKPVARVEWDAGAVNLTADEALTGAAGDGNSAVIDCANWLRNYLTPDPRPAAEVVESAEANLYSKGTLKRAKALIGIESQQVRCGDKSNWVWLLPGASLCAEPGAHEATAL